MEITKDSESTPSATVTQQLYVEKLISQARNNTTSITAPSSVALGQEFDITVVASTATEFDEIAHFLNVDPSLLQIQSISVTYSKPSGATNNAIYRQNAGGDVSYTFRLKAIKEGTAQMRPLIYDRSGSSYHYPNDFDNADRLITISIGSTNNPPGTFSLVSPINNLTVNTLKPTFDWQDAIDPNGDAVTYTLWYDTRSDFTTKKEVPDLTTSIYSPTTPLQDNTIYYWKVKASDAKGKERWSDETWQFKVKVKGKDVHAHHFLRVGIQGEMI
ncbi:MAG: hypothetical protein AB1756_06955 [Acidobacteriota bacterium]